jgi:putative SOS response-associated peptidase YedK
MVSQDLKSLERQLRASVDLAAFEGLFKRRNADDGIKIAKALEANFDEPATPVERRIRGYIVEYRERMAKRWEGELFRQKQRLATAEQALKVKQTRKALEDRRIAGNKIDGYLRRLAALKRRDLNETDSRIFPFWYAPVLVLEGGRPVIRPMRYHCRPAGKPASYDRRYPGLYNARRDKLEGFWKRLFGHRHAVLVVRSFFENVARHDFEKRPLREGEQEENLVLHFDPTPATEMLVACLWDRWEGKGEADLESFAAITDEPPPEVAATGHNRCIIPLKQSNLRAWLDAGSRDQGAFYDLLDDRERPYYAHELAA